VKVTGSEDSPSLHFKKQIIRFADHPLYFRRFLRRPPMSSKKQQPEKQTTTKRHDDQSNYKIDCRGNDSQSSPSMKRENYCRLSSSNQHLSASTVSFPLPLSWFLVEIFWSWCVSHDFKISGLMAKTLICPVVIMFRYVMSLNFDLEFDRWSRFARNTGRDRKFPR
jgi:hypothetical protein